MEPYSHWFEPCISCVTNSIVREVTRSLSRIQHEAASIDWSKIFKASFMLLFIAYPGTSEVQDHDNDGAHAAWLL